MADFPEGFFKDPEKDRKQLIELVANYARNVPDLLPALRDVINYGLLYDRKLKAFIDLLHQERRRQRSLSVGEGYETDHVDKSENMSICSTETPKEEDLPVKQKKKKKKNKELTDSISVEAREEIKTDELAIDEDYPKDTENVLPYEEDPPVKKKKKKKARTQDYDSSVTVESGHLRINGADGSCGAEGGSLVDDVKPENEVKEEAEAESVIKGEEKPDVTTMDGNILINTVGGADQNPTRSKLSSVSNTKNTPRKINKSLEGESPSGSAPIRVIPSVKLMEDPTRFPDLDPSLAEPSSTLAKPKKWRVSFGFDWRVAHSGRWTEADVCAALDQCGLRNIRVLEVLSPRFGSYLVRVEFFSSEFLSDGFLFSDDQVSVDGVPRVIDASQIIDGQSCETDVKARRFWVARCGRSEDSSPSGSDSSMRNHPSADVAASSGGTASADPDMLSSNFGDSLQDSPSTSSQNGCDSLARRDRPGTSLPTGYDCPARDDQPSTSSQNEYDSAAHNDRPSTSSQSGYVSPARNDRPSTSSQTGYDSPARHDRPSTGSPSEYYSSRAAYRQSLNARIIKLLTEAGQSGDCWCVKPAVVRRFVRQNLPAGDYDRFMAWMFEQKQKIIARPYLISTHVIFREFPDALFQFEKDTYLPPKTRKRKNPRQIPSGRKKGRRGKAC